MRHKPSSFPPDEADSSVICTDTAHPLTSFAPTNPSNLSKYDDPSDVNANKQRAKDRWDDQPLIPDRKRNTGYACYNDNIAANCVLASACVVSHRLRYYPKQAVIPAVPADTAKHRPQSKCDTRPMAHDGNQALRTPDAVTAASTEL